MTDKIDTSTLGRMDLASGRSEPIEVCASSWAVDDNAASRILMLLGGYRDEMSPGAVKAFQELARYLSAPS